MHPAPAIQAAAPVEAPYVRASTPSGGAAAILALDLGPATDRTVRTPEIAWREVPDWPAYQVSSDGRVRRIGAARGAETGRVLRQLLNKKTGYYSVCLSRDSRQKRIDVHRLVALAFLGPQPSHRHLVAHNDGVRTNNSVGNLRWATQAENLRDCYAHGTVRIGSKNPAASILEIDVLAIRRMKAAGIPRSVIASGYGMHTSSIFRILARASWEHVL